MRQSKWEGALRRSSSRRAARPAGGSSAARRPRPRGAQEALPSAALATEPTEAAAPSGAGERPPRRPPRGGRSPGASERPQERLLEDASWGQKRGQLSTKHLTAPAGESSRKTISSETTGASPGSPGAQPAPDNPRRGPERARPPEPHLRGSSGRHSAVAPRPRLHPLPPRPCPRTPGSALGPAAEASPRGPPLALAEKTGDRSGPGSRPGAQAASPSSPQPPRTPRRPQTLPPPRRPRPFPRSRNRKRPAGPAPPPNAARRLGPAPQTPRGACGPAHGRFPPRPRAWAPTPRTGEEAAPRARRETGRGLGGKARRCFSSPRGRPTSLWSGAGAGPSRGARTGWGAPRRGSASRPSSASSPSPGSPLGRGGWVGGDSGRVAKSQ